MAPTTSLVCRSRASLAVFKGVHAAASEASASIARSARGATSQLQEAGPRDDAATSTSKDEPSPSGSPLTRGQHSYTVPALASKVNNLLQLGQHLPALRLLLGKQLPLGPKLASRPPTRLAHAYDAALRDAARRGDATAAWALTARMWSLGLPLGFVAHSGALQAVATGQGPRRALRYLRSVGYRHLDTRLCNIVLAAAARQGDEAVVEATLALMERRGLAPDAGTWVARAELAATRPQEDGSVAQAVQCVAEDALSTLPASENAELRAGVVAILARWGLAERVQMAFAWSMYARLEQYIFHSCPSNVVPFPSLAERGSLRGRKKACWSCWTGTARRCHCPWS